MKIICTVFFTFLVTAALLAQNTAKARQLVKEGVQLHDEGKYAEAIGKYDAALAEDASYFSAWYEKSFSLSALGKSEEVVAISKRLLKDFPNEPDLKLVYVSYGNVLDESGKGKAALKIYDEGIRKFPDFYLLHFNKGISLSMQNKTEEAIPYFQKAVVLNPDHAGSHNALGRLLINRNKVPGVLALMRMLVIEPQTKRAAENWQTLQPLLMPESKKEITISADFLLGSLKEKKKENSFVAQELMLATLGGEVKSDDGQPITGMKKLIIQLNLFFAGLANENKENAGFYWDYYAPYFAALQKSEHLNTFAYIIQATGQDAGVQEWLKSHGKEIEAFYEWDKQFEWMKK
jgi:tetratricopeptide (TPR) repeat protein